MRKINLVLIGLFSISGCAAAKEDQSIMDKNDDFIIEEHAVLKVQMDDVKYANAMQLLWDTLYPKHKGALHINTSETQETYDIKWTREDSIGERTSLYNIEEVQETMEVGVEGHLQRTSNYFLPVEGKGLVFLYNERELKRRGGTEKELAHFEQMMNWSDDVYYHNREEAYVYPFLFSSMHKETLSEQQAMFYDNLVRYRSLYKELSLYDDQLHKQTFYNDGSYVCGLVENDGRYMTSTLYKEGYLHFSKMPDYKGISYAPRVDTYGFVVRKQTKYPGAACAFLAMIRSEEGLNQLIKNTNKTPLISSEDMQSFFVFDQSQKELIEALNGSQLKDIKREDEFQQEELYNTIQNALYTKESNAMLKKRIAFYVDQWT